MAALVGAARAKGRRGWTGVPNAGDEDGMEDEGRSAAWFLAAKNGVVVVAGFVLLDAFSGLSGFVFLLFFRGLCITIMV